MPAPQMEALQTSISNFQLAESQPAEFAGLATHLADNIQRTMGRLEAEGRSVEVFGPDWCRQNPALAGRLHADVIVGHLRAAEQRP
ncbi:MAG TPA: hypothetical protein VMR45_00590 [Patescibacteria group bacterium]|nr:hypothetical protein [Patescibacteria group bacterium]